MKKTNSTFAKTWSNFLQRQASLMPLSLVVTIAMLLSGNFAFGQIMDPCPPGSGNMVLNCPPVNPAPLPADGNCQAVVPDFRPGVTGAAGAGYDFVGAVQVPMAGTLLTGTGNHNIQVGAAFLNLPVPADPQDGLLCAEVCPTIVQNVFDNTNPTISCANPQLVADANCQVVLTDSIVLAQLLSGFSDNCTDPDDISITFNPPILAGPSCPADPNPVIRVVTVTATDLSGNMNSCMANVGVADLTGPSVIFNLFANGTNMDTIPTDPATCGALTPDLTGMATVLGDNCAGPLSPVSQFPPAGTPYTLPDTSANGCVTEKIQPIDVTVMDCYGNDTTFRYFVHIHDQEAPAITSTCAALPPQAPVVVDSTCMVNIPDLTGLLTATDNCVGPITWIQTPVGLTDVSGLCPPNNTIDVTFTAVDCFGNQSAPLTCPDVLTFIDNSLPTIVCPAAPITVVVPFDGATCQTDVATVDLAFLIANGVTVADNCDPAPALTNLDPTSFSCDDIGMANLSITIEATDCFGNVGSGACPVDVVADVDLTAAWSIGGGDFIVCPEDEFPVCIEFGPNTPTCGVWSGDVAVSVWSGTVCASGFALEASSFPDLDSDGTPDPGSYSITYTVGPPGCHVSETHNIMISPQFNAADAALIGDTTICMEATEIFDLEGLLAPGAVQGGLYTITLTGAATGQQIGNLFQYLGGDGDLTVVYVLEDCDANIETDTVVISIDEKPDGHFSLPANFCQDEGSAVPIITGVPAGASIEFSSLPVGYIVNPATGLFDPTAGPLAGEFADVFVTMQVTNGVCDPYFISQWIVVYASGDPAFVLPDTICESAAPLNLVLTNPLNDGGVNPLIPSNVNWTGTGVTDIGTTGVFDPQDLAPGYYNVCVTVGAPSCEEQLCQDIFVAQDYTPEEVALIDDFSLCMFPDDIIDFAGLLVGTGSGSIANSGTFTVTEQGDLNGVGTINPNNYIYHGECGTLEIVHFFPDDCVPNSDTIVITIEQKPDVGGLAIPGPLCAQDPIAFIEYSGTPVVCGTPGVFSAPISPAGTLTDFGTGTTAVFDPVAAGEGLHIIQYEIGNPVSGCYAIVFAEIEVKASSDPEFTLPSTSCANEVIDLALDNPDPSVLPSSPDGITEITWFGGDGLNAVVTDNGDGTGTFVGYHTGTYTVCVQTGDIGCTQYRCHQITVDNVPPVLDCAPLVRVVDNSVDSCNYTQPGTAFDVTATDNCSPPNSPASIVLTHNYPVAAGHAVSANTLMGATFPVGITQVIWTATDTAGNSSNCTIEIVVVDNEDPTVTFCPADTTLGTDLDICGAELNYLLPQFEDNCDGLDLEGVLTEGLAPGADFPLGTTTVTWVYTDLADNTTAVCSFDVTVVDDDNPIPVCQPFIDVVLDGDGLAQLIADDVDLNSSDNCGIVSTLIDRGFGFVPAVLFSCDDLGTNIVTLEVEDAAGNDSTCTSIVTVYDLQVPDIECTGNITVVADPALCAAVVVYNPPTVVDNCATAVTQIDGTGLTSGSIFPVGTTVQTYVAIDSAGNADTCSFTIYVYDEVAPTIDCGPTVRTQTADPGVCSFTVSDASFDAAGFDNCPGVVITHNYPIAVDSNTLAGSTFPVGTTLVTWIATDASGNQSAICGIQIVITDDEDPTITCTAAPTVFDNDPGLCSYKVDDTSLDPTASDNCPDFEVNHDYAMAPSNNSLNGAVFPVGSTNVGFTVTDASGNTATCSITVTVNDTEDPVFTNCPTTMVMIGNDPDQCSGKLNWSIPVATDNCELASVIQTAGPPNGTPVAVGVPMTVIYTATDIYGNTSTCMFDVQVVDTQNPEFDADIVMPGNITVQCNAVPPPFVLTNDDVHDNCTTPANLVITFTQTSTQGVDPNNCNFYNYTITRTWTVTDQAGNMLVHTQIITVQDTQAPVPSCQDATVTLDKFGQAIIDPALLIAGTTDNCAPFSALTVTASQTTFTCANLGPNNVTLTISDPCGNTATCTIVVTVNEGIGACTPQGVLATSCLNNATTLTNGQFLEMITIQGLAMQNWTILGSNGLYSNASPNPPAAPTPIANGTALTMGSGDGIDNDGDGQIDEADEMVFYTISARFVEAFGYTATLTNNLGQIVTISNNAFYPTPVLVDFNDPFCLSTPAFIPEVVDQFAGANAYVSVTFLVDGIPVAQVDPSTLSVGQHTLTVIVDAGTARLARRVNGVLVPGDAANNAEGRLDPGCIQSFTEFFQVVTTPSQVVCNDLINVTLDPGCVSTILPDDVLEGSYSCFDDYTVNLYLPNGIPLNPHNQVTGAHVGITINYILVHPVSGNTCWGTVNVEDKTSPEAICPGDVTILCTVDPDSVVYWVPPTHPLYPATDYWGNLVPVNDSLLYLGEPTAIDCSPWIWDFAYTDDYTLYECVDNPALIAEITRTFIIQDIWGNADTCHQQITWVRGEADQVNWPADTVVACNYPYLDLLAASNYSPDSLGWPFIWGPNDSRLSIYGNGICNLGLTYSDQLVNVCVNEYKVVRTWTLYDWCPANGGPPTQTVHVQYIKIENVAPIITVECLEIDPATGYCVLNATEAGVYPHYPCYAIFVPYAQVEAVCDDIVEITIETPGGSTSNGGIIPGGGLPIGGPYVITYRAEDQCGHITELELTVIVRDLTSPIAVCDEITDVNLSSDGLATVYAETFDDGSYDGCCLDQFLVRKMDGDPCGLGGEFFGPSVTFCCEDIANNPVMVVFRAVDCNGNYNDCMVEVNVNDKSAPIRTFCPPDKRITCDWYADNLETQLQGLTGAEQCQLLTDAGFGEATFEDNCPLTINCNTSINLDQCLEGVITRTFTAVDGAGNTASQNCTTRIFVDHVSDWVVEFPADITVNCGTSVPDFGEPEIFYETCELVAVSYEDQFFNVVQDACYKILRTWTVINWCVVGNNIDQEVVEQPENQLGLIFPLCDLDGDGDCDNRTFRDSWNSSAKPSAAQATQTTNPDTDLDSDPWDGYITYQQTIKVTDNVDPVIVDCTIPDVCIVDNTCLGSFQLPIPEIEECSPIVTITAQIQFNGVWTNAGSVTLESGVTTDAFTTFNNINPGVYNVRYVVTDNCNNQTECETTVTVEDCKLPTPYCKDGLVIELMLSGMVETWARDFDAGSFDNCPGDLFFSFSTNPADSGEVYTCDSVGLRTVRIYVTDAAGNQDFCVTLVEIQANQNQCDDSLNVAVGGLIETEDSEGVAEVNVQLSGAAQSSMMTDDNGMFNFTVVPGGDYTITPVKDDDPLNGVTTFDLVLISKHILGVQALNSPYKLIAADANKSGTVTTFDLVSIRKLILFIDTAYPNNTSWRFVDKDFIFPNPQNPWQTVFPEIININNITADQLAADFVAVKIGDVNSSAETNFAGGNEERNTNGRLIFSIDDVQLELGQQYTVDFKARDFNVLGYQFTLNFDRKALEFADVIPGVAGAENFGLTLLENGVITTSWNDNNANVADDQVVFSLVFNATSSGKLSDALNVNSRFTKAEAYRKNGDLLDVELVFNGASTVRNFELYQNTPNPFSTYTMIGFNLPEPVSATLNVTDVSGKVVKTVTQEFAKGYNEIKLERRELPATGILYYQLDTPTDSATKMMLLMD